MQTNWIGLSFGVIGIIALAAYFREGYQRKHARFAARKDLSLAEIYDHYFVQTEVSKEKFDELWSEVAGTLELPPGKLRPTDSFAEELYPAKGYEYDDQVYTLGHIAQRHARQMNIEQAEVDKIKTIFDYVVVFGVARPNKKFLRIK